MIVDCDIHVVAIDRYENIILQWSYQINVDFMYMF